MNSKFPLKATWKIYNKCNLDCKICYSINHTDKNYELSYNQCLDILEKLKELDVLYLFFSGGEPLLKNRIFDILSVSTQYFCTWIQTNGTMIQKEEAKTLSKCHINTIFVDLYGHEASIHDSYTRTKNSFSMAINGIENLLNENINVMTSTILTKDNYLYMKEYVDLCKNLKINKINILRGYYYNNPEFKEYITLSHEELKYAIDSLTAACKKHNIKLGHSFGEKNHNCCEQAISIDSMGNLKNCPYLSEMPNLGSFLEDDPVKLWNNAQSIYVRNSYKKSPKECYECSHFNYCGGGCTANKYMTEKKINIKDPICWF